MAQGPEDVAHTVGQAIGPGHIGTSRQAAPAVPTVAIIATHGMGQQVPFETIDAITLGLVRVVPQKVKSAVQTRTVQLTDQTLQRAEFRLETMENRVVEVHVYEGYWAPLTEGQTTLRDVLRFLLYGGLNGAINSRSRNQFWRYLFGTYWDFGPQGKRNRTWLLTAFAAIFSVMLLTALALLVTSHAGLQATLNVGASNPWIPAPLLVLWTHVVTIFVGCSVLMVLAFTLLFWLRKKRFHKSKQDPSQDHFWVNACRAGSLLLYLWIVISIASAAAVLGFGIGGDWLAQKLLRQYPFLAAGPAWLPIVVWSLLYVFAFFIRNFTVQYLGDVAAYVQPQVLDRFLAIRMQIKSWVMDVVQAVYLAKDGNKQFVYENVILIGHSLGSVIAYDVLDLVINQDLLNRGANQIVSRTRALITFGSPLDKTAFVFGHQRTHTSITREALAASVQPLIQSYTYRSFEWINIHAKRDVISNDLMYYDLPVGHRPPVAKPVRNVSDKDALIPLLAHTEYWRNSTLFNLIYSKL